MHTAAPDTNIGPSNADVFQKVSVNFIFVCNLAFGCNILDLDRLDDSILSNWVETWRKMFNPVESLSDSMNIAAVLSISIKVGGMAESSTHGFL